jgi:hypothetical protein
MILALIYVFTQLLGFLTGVKYSFFNKDAELAYRKTRGQLGYDDFLRVAVRPVAQRAQMRLGQLRSKLSSANPGYSDHMQPFDFMDAYHRSLAEHECKAVSQPVAGTPSLASQVTVLSAGSSLEKIARAIVGVQDLEQRRKTAAELIHSHGLTREQQGALALIIEKVKDEQDIDPDLLKSL